MRRERINVLQFAQDPQRSVDDVTRAYAEGWLGLGGRDAGLASRVIAGLGTVVSDVQTSYLSPDDGAGNPEADERLRRLIDARSRTPGLEDNYRYWLLHYRAVWESLAIVKGPLSLDVLRQEGNRSRDALARLEPEFGHYLAKLGNWGHPGLIPWSMPRTYAAAWKRENSFIAPSHG